MSLINREALLAEYDRVHVGEPGKARKLIEDAPTIELRCEECEAFNKTRLLIPQPERKKGKWIKRDVPRQIHSISCSAPNWQCSVCKKWWFHNGEGLKWYKFCPECGADMRGDDHDL